MRRIIVVISVIALALAEHQEGCGPRDLPKDVAFGDCCQLKVSMIPLETIKSCISTCKASGPPPPPPPPSDAKGPPPMMPCCITDCALKQLGIFDGKAINKDKAVEMLSANDSSVKPIVEKAVTYCLQQSPPSPPPAAEATAPSILPIFMIGCTYGQIYKECGSNLVKSDQCTALTTFANKCNWVPPMKPSPMMMDKAN